MKLNSGALNLALKITEEKSPLEGIKKKSKFPWGIVFYSVVLIAVKYYLYLTRWGN